MLSLQDIARPRPAGGRSRFSKALPSVPIGDNDMADLPPLPLPKDLSELRFPLPPRKSSRGNDENKSSKTIARKPVGSSASKSTAPLSDASTFNSPPVSSSPTGSKAMTRKPVLSALQLPVQPVLVVPSEASPTDSISSLLSAYSREPDAPLSGSTYTTASTVNSFHDSYRSPSLGKDAPSAGGHACSQTQVSAVKSEQSTEHKSQSHPAPSLPSSPFPKPLLLTAPLLEQQSPRAEIWKRRPLTAEKTKEFSGLKLNYSHGSTASTASIQSIETAVLMAYATTASESKPTEEPKQYPRSPPAVVGLPGRNIKPEPKEKKQEAAKQMGSFGSKMQGKLGRLQSSGAATDHKDLPARPDIKRPPTPEYRKGDAGPPQSIRADAHAIAKPASPVSVTGSPKEDILSKTSKPLPPQPISKSRLELEVSTPVDIPPIGPKSVKRLPRAEPGLRVATSHTEMKPSIPPPPGKTSPPAKLQSSPVKDIKRTTSGSSDSTIGRVPLGQNSVGPRVGGPSKHTATVTSSSDPKFVISDTQGPVYRGRDGTLYREMEAVGEPDPKALYFPIQTDRPVQTGTVISSKSLDKTHYNCFQKHRTMSRRPNRNYPLTCQTCDKADVEDRWVCTFCHLRICETCLQGLNGHQRVLERLVDQLRTNTPLSLSSVSRPGSAFGIELRQ
ncbi:hypothetical protein ED733_002852 [Metarhizium rileyi]|uniref:Uncharacterized protein n=1 Tax=Metarhizium rileyi (strain RCEF 4871) TaxID=1649241 RepID=A0A5C6GFQ2_METRR|nr:hypothetical protein ED733_002852 [Metarhizium rileyi]